MERIKAYFEEQIKTDPALAEAYKEEKLDKCWKYITSQAKSHAKNGCAMIEDAQVYKWARDFMLGDIPEEFKQSVTPKTKKAAEDNNSVTSEEIETGAPDSDDFESRGTVIEDGIVEIVPDLITNKESKKLVIEKVEEEPAEVMQPVSQKEKKSKKADEYDGPSLFDFDDLF